MLKLDLAAAGIPTEIDGPEGSEVRDFHALRNCYISDVLRTGADLKQAMTLARHSDPKLTAGRYARTRLFDLGAVVNKLPTPAAPTPATTEPAVLRMTGTDDTGAIPAQQSAAPSAADIGYVRLRVRAIEETSPPDETGMERLNPLVSQGVEDDQGRSRTIRAERAGFSDRDSDVCSRTQQLLEIIVHLEATSRPIDRQVLGSRNRDCHKTATRYRSAQQLKPTSGTSLPMLLRRGGNGGGWRPPVLTPLALSLQHTTILSDDIARCWLLGDLAISGARFSTQQGLFTRFETNFTERRGRLPSLTNKSGLNSARTNRMRSSSLPMPSAPAGSQGVSSLADLTYSNGANLDVLEQFTVLEFRRLRVLAEDLDLARQTVRRCRCHGFCRGVVGFGTCGCRTKNGRWV